jgi:uncharacterized protein
VTVPYTASQRQLQHEHGTENIAALLEAATVAPQLNEKARAFVESRDFFFLSTVNADGEPTVSYKGGAVGVVSVLDEQTIVFPSYDGNGMFLSLGNIAETAKIGLLFIDFETPHRLRVQATAAVSSDASLLARYPGAQLVVQATIDRVFVNCARMIHRHTRVSQSPYVPDGNGAAAYPAWKRIDLLQDALPESDHGRTTQAGGTITIEEYERLLAQGES